MLLVTPSPAIGSCLPLALDLSQFQTVRSPIIAGATKRIRFLLVFDRRLKIRPSPLSILIFNFAPLVCQNSLKV